MDKADLIRDYGFQDISNDQFDILVWEFEEPVGNPRHSIRICLGSEKGKNVWDVGSDISNYPTSFNNVSEALNFIRVKSGR